jgi:hypothetical protein
MKNNKKEVRTPIAPIRKKKKDGFLKPYYLLSLFWIMVAVAK